MLREWSYTAIELDLHSPVCLHRIHGYNFCSSRMVYLCVYFVVSLIGAHVCTGSSCEVRQLCGATSNFIWKLNAVSAVNITVTDIVGTLVRHFQVTSLVSCIF
jgi:hypothetical protein